MSMRKEQKIVALGALSGIGGMAFLVTVLAHILPTPETTSVLDQMTLALCANVLAIIPLVVMIANVGNKRFLGKAIDPTLHAESKKMEIDGRVVDNTLQQNFVFFVGTLALSTVLFADEMAVIPALAIVFITARVAFWLGYRHHPLYRAPGMAATAYMNLGILLFTLYRIVW